MAQNPFKSEPAPVSELLCPDWIFTTASNVHISRHRGWYYKYDAFGSQVIERESGRTLTVAGIGTVIVPIDRPSTPLGDTPPAWLVLNDVLHVPEFEYNIIARSDDFWFKKRGKWDQIASNGRDSKLASDDERVSSNSAGQRKALRIRVSKPPGFHALAPSSFDEDNTPPIDICWGPFSMQLWVTQKWRGKRSSTVGDGVVQSFKYDKQFVSPAGVLVHMQPPYTLGETDWLNHRFGDEFEISRSYFFSIREDVESGGVWKIENGWITHGLIGSVRSIFQDDMIQVDYEIEKYWNAVNGKSNAVVNEDDSFDFEGYVTDSQFDRKTLDWIRKFYGNSKEFMSKFELKFYAQVHCNSARDHAKLIMIKPPPGF